MNLIEEGLYGDPADPLREILARFHLDFRAWCKHFKVRTSQRRFTPKMVLWLQASFREVSCCELLGR